MNTFDFKVVKYNGTDHLTWSSMGLFSHYFSDMEDLTERAAFIADSAYNIEKKLVIKEGADYDIHEFTVVDDGKSAIMTHEKEQPQNVSSMTSKYPDGYKARNKGFREINLSTGRTVFEWYALDHGVTIEESFNLVELNEDGRSSWDYL